MEEEHDDNDGYEAQGQVDVEAPAPGCVLGENTTEQGANDCGYAEH